MPSAKRKASQPTGGNISAKPRPLRAATRGCAAAHRKLADSEAWERRILQAAPPREGRGTAGTPPAALFPRPREHPVGSVGGRRAPAIRADGDDTRDCEKMRT